jgi:TolB-like protein
MSDSNRTVFISYASEDVAAATRLRDDLQAGGVEVWLDLNELIAGEEWDQRIRVRIRTCQLFIAVVSANTERRLEGYFRREWEMAADRTHNMARGRAFLLPVFLGRSLKREFRVPEEFLAVQWTCLEDGHATPAFITRIRQLLDQVEDAEPVPVTATAAVATPRARPRPRRWFPFVAAGLVLLAAGWFVSRGTRAVTPPAPHPAPAGPKVANPRSIAVLPLLNRAADPEAGAIGETIQSEIISALTRLPDEQVASRDATLAFKAGDAPVDQIALTLNVANLVTGSVLREGSQVHLEISLRQAGDPEVIWSKTNTAELKDVPAARALIADQVIRALQARAARGTFASAKFATASPVAADLFSKAWTLIKATDSSTEAIEQGVEIAEECSRSDPEFTTAAVLLCDAHARLAARYMDPEKASANADAAKEWADKASRMALGGDSAMGLAIYFIKVAHDPARGMAFVERSLRAVPNEAMLYHLKALALAQGGNFDGSIAQDRLALALDPRAGEYWESVLTSLARLRRPAGWAAALKEGQAASGDRLSGACLDEGRFALAGKLPDNPSNSAPLLAAAWYWRARKFAEALAALNSDLEDTELGEAARVACLVAQSDVFARLGRAEESARAARAAWESAERLQKTAEGRFPEADLLAAQSLSRNGRNDEAIAAALRYVGTADASAPASERWRREIQLAALDAYLKHTDEAVLLLSKLLAEPSGLTVPMLRVDPTWDNLREDTRFKSLLVEDKNLSELRF